RPAPSRSGTRTSSAPSSPSPDRVPCAASCARRRNASRAALASPPLAQHPADGWSIDGGDVLLLAEAPLPLRRLLRQVVALHRLAAQQLAAGVDLKPLLGAARCFRLG